MFRLLNVISLIFLAIFVATSSEATLKSKRTLNNPMASNKEGQSNLYPVPWFGPPLPGMGFPGYPFYVPPPPNPQAFFDQVQAFQAQVNKQINDQIKQNDCEPTEVYTEDYTVGGKNYTYIKKTCKVNGPNGSASSSSSSTFPSQNTGSSSSSSSGPVPDSSSSSGPSPGSGSSSSSSSGPSPDSSSSSSSSSFPASDQSSSSSSSSSPSSDQGPVASSSSGSGASSGASSGPGSGSGAFSSAGGGMAVASASG